MDELKELYFNIENPILNKEKWEYVLDSYSTSLDFQEFLEKLKIKNIKDLSGLDVDEKESFQLILWSNFKQKLLILSEEELKEFIDNDIFDSEIYEVVKTLRSLPSIKTYAELTQVLEDENIRHYFSFFINEKEHKVKAKSDFNLDYKTTIISVKIEQNSLYKFLKLFVKTCNENELPFNLEFKENKESVRVKILTSIENSPKYVSILGVLVKEYFSYFKKMTIDAIFEGNLDDYITIKHSNYLNYDNYLVSRSSILFKAIDSVMYEYVINHLSTVVAYKGGKINLAEYLSKCVVEKTIDKLINKNIRTKEDYYIIANSTDLIEFKSFVDEKLSLELRDILKDRLYLKKENDYIPLKLKSDSVIDIDIKFFMATIRTLLPILVMKDSTLDKAFKIRLKNECLVQKIDPNKMCLDEDFSKKIFFDKSQYDKYRSELDKISSELDKFNNLTKLLSVPTDQFQRDEIKKSIEELKIFEEKEE